jgi:hypothetical protein
MAKKGFNGRITQGFIDNAVKIDRESGNNRSENVKKHTFILRSIIGIFL